MLRSEKYKRYFKALIDELREQHNFTKARKVQGVCYYGFASGFTGIKYYAKFSGAYTATALHIHFGNYDKNKIFFDVLKEREHQINPNFDVTLYWYRRDDIDTSVIGFARDGDIESDASELEAIKAWHIKNLLKFKAVFTPEIQRALETLQSREIEPE